MGRWDRDARDHSNRNSRKSCLAPGRQDQSLSPVVLALPSPSALQQCHRPRRVLVTYTPSRPLVVVEGDPERLLQHGRARRVGLGDRPPSAVSASAEGSSHTSLLLLLVALPLPCHRYL
jgi:hypothetical protein